MEVQDAGPQETVVPAIATIIVDVLDENDNNPVFSPTLYSATIVDNSTVPAILFTVSATDADAGSNANVTFAITSENPGNAFSLSPYSGVLSLVKPIPTAFQTYQLAFTASDHGNPPRSGFATAVITASQRAYFDFSVSGLGYSLPTSVPGSTHDFGFFAGAAGVGRQGTVKASLGQFEVNQTFSVQRHAAVSARAVLVESEFYSDARQMHVIAQVNPTVPSHSLLSSSIHCGSCGTMLALAEHPRVLSSSQ